MLAQIRRGKGVELRELAGAERHARRERGKQVTSMQCPLDPLAHLHNMDISNPDYRRYRRATAASGWPVVGVGLPPAAIARARRYQQPTPAQPAEPTAHRAGAAGAAVPMGG